MATFDDIVTELTAPATGDKLLVRDISDASYKDKFMTLSRLAVLSLANTFSALQTFGAGLASGTIKAASAAGLSVQDDGGNEAFKINDGGTLTFPSGTWLPYILGSVSNPTVSLSEQSGDYVRIGQVILFALRLRINTISGGSGLARITLPIAPAGTTYAWQGTLRVQGVNIPGTAAALTFNFDAGNSYGVIAATQDDATTQYVGVTDLAAGDYIFGNGFYFV